MENSSKNQSKISYIVQPWVVKIKHIKWGFFFFLSLFLLILTISNLYKIRKLLFFNGLQINRILKLIDFQNSKLQEFHQNIFGEIFADVFLGGNIYCESVVLWISSAASWVERIGGYRQRWVQLLKSERKRTQVYWSSSSVGKSRIVDKLSARQPSPVAPNEFIASSVLRSRCRRKSGFVFFSGRDFFFLISP